MYAWITSHEQKVRNMCVWFMLYEWLGRYVSCVIDGLWIEGGKHVCVIHATWMEGGKNVSITHTTGMKGRRKRFLETNSHQAPRATSCPDGAYMEDSCTQHSSDSVHSVRWCTNFCLTSLPSSPVTDLALFPIVIRAADTCIVQHPKLPSSLLFACFRVLFCFNFF